MVLGKLDNHIKKEWSWTLIHSTQKVIQIDLIPKYRTLNFKILRKKHGKTDMHGNNFLDIILKAENKSKSGQNGIT